MGSRRFFSASAIDYQNSIDFQKKSVKNKKILHKPDSKYSRLLAKSKYLSPRPKSKNFIIKPDNLILD